MKIFIGSSQEQLESARIVASWIEQWNHQPVLWSDNTVFPLGTYTFESLINISNTVDVAIFIFGADDKTWFRNKTISSVRDNVLLEYGLFCGKLSKERVIFLCKDSPQIATDLAGITYANLDNINNTFLTLKNKIDNIATQHNSEITLYGDFQVTSLYNAFQIAFHNSLKIKSFRVFAVSTFKSVQMMQLMTGLHIEHAYVLLREYIENDFFYEERMETAISNAVLSWKKMYQRKNIANLHLSFFNYHPDDGFYIIDDRYLIIGYLNFDISLRQSEFADNVILIDNKTEAGRKWIQCYIEKFDKIYALYKTKETFLK